MFTQRFSSTPLGARLARQLSLHQLHGWGIPHGTRISDTAALIVAEPCANAATHGRVPGRDFELRLTLTEAVLRIEVSDTRDEKRPPSPGEVTAPPALSETRRGLLLVGTLANRWTVIDRPPVGKTVRAELDMPQ